MAGRANYQTAEYQCIRPGELWQCNWLEETGTIVSLVYDIKEKRITTMLGFSKGNAFPPWRSHRSSRETDKTKGHWEHPEAAHGDKRNAADLERWRGLAREGIQTDRHMLSEQARIKEVYHGAGELEPIEHDAPTM